MSSPVIATNYSPTYPGGLAVLQTHVASLLSVRDGRPGAFLYRYADHPELPATHPDLPWPAFQLSLTRFGRLTEKLWPRLASRPQSLPLLAGMLSRCWKMPHTLTPSVIHFIGTGWDLTGFFLAAEAARRRIPFTVFPATHPGQWGDDRIDIALYRRAGAVLCQTDFERDHLASLGAPPARLFRLGLFPMCSPHGDASAFRARHDLGNRPCVYFLGRRTVGKGYPALLTAWPLVLARHPDAVLLLAGPHWIDRQDHGLSALPPDSFRDLGLPDGPAISDAYAACDVFCLPSDGESFGIVLVEAWSYGKPVICGSAPASREMVADGENGLWADHDPSALSEKIIRLLDDPSLARRMGEAGHRLQQQRFTPSAFLSRLDEAATLAAPRQ